MSRNKFARYVQDAVPGEWFSDDSVSKVMSGRGWRSVVGRRRTGGATVTGGGNVTNRKRASDGRRKRTEGEGC